MKILDKLLSRESIFKKSEVSLLEHILTFAFARKVKKGQCILHEGDVNDKMFYIQSGFFRVYEVEKEKEINTWFVGSGDFILSIHSFYHEVPTTEYIEALEDSEVFSIRKDLYFLLLKNHHKLAMFTINELMENLCEFQQQCRILRQMNAESKYRFLAEKKPKIINKISQKHLASFLGIDITYMSKIIKHAQAEIVSQN